MNLRHLLGVSVIVSVPSIAAATPPTWDVVGTKYVNVASTILIPIHVTDPQGDAITITTDPANPAFATVAVINNTDATITATPSLGDAGSYTVRVFATNQTDPVTVPLDVTLIVNRPPALNAPTSVTAVVGVAKTLDLSATDADGDPLVLSLDGLAGLTGTTTFTDNGNGAASATITAVDLDIGEYGLDAAVNDGRGGIVHSTVTLSVVATPPMVDAGSPDAPTDAPDTASDDAAPSDGAGLGDAGNALDGGKGSGCCSSSSDPASALVGVVLVGLALRRRARR